ncbi:hypothetical protein EV363DRAFT_1262570 [Boletus edulis]|nr:hypothetical protein EV363DRAFT_1262570 [Boletus edulis]
MDHHDEPLPHPNFALPGFAALVELTMLAQQMDQDEAIVFLEQRWVQTGLGGIRPDQPEANDGELRRDGVARRRPGRDPSPERDALRGNPAQAAQPADPAPAAGLQPITFDPDVRIATTLTARPADYAIKRIEARKHVPLWYFTREGLREAARTVRQADENDTLAVTKAEEGQVTVRSAGSLAASKNAKLDHQLTYNEFMYAKNLFLTAIDNAKWGDDTIDSFNWFFHHLDNHPIREEGERGEKALLLYASRARTDWHDKLALRKAYNIAAINEDLLAKIARELDSREVRMNLEQMDQARSNRFQPTDRGRQFTREARRRPSRSASPRFTPRGPRPVRRRSRSRERSPRRSHSHDNKRRRPFRNNKAAPVCPKCLGRHEDRPDRPVCNASSLWDNSGATYCTRDQQGRLLNKSGRVLCWDFQRPRGCSSQGHNHECSGCGDTNHGAQDCPRRQQPTSPSAK